MAEWSNSVWVDPLVLASIVATLAGAYLRARKTFKRFSREWSLFQQDWGGTAARPGVPARAGVMERLGDQDTKLAKIEHELSFNSGLSVKDAVHRIDRTLNGETP